MSRANFSGARKELDAPFLERPDADATKGDRFFFHLIQGYLRLTLVAYVVLGLMTLAMLIVNPAAGAVALALVLVGILIYRA